MQDRVRRGEPLRIEADTYNALLDLLRRSQGRAHDQAATLSAATRCAAVVTVRNDSGYDLDWFGIAGVSGVVFDPAYGGDAEDGFRNEPLLSVVTPATTHVGRFVVAAEPIADGQMGRAYAAGTFPVRVKLGEEAGHYADVLDGDNAKLLTGPTGAARLLYTGRGSAGDTVWAVAALGPVRLYPVSSATPEDDGPGLEVVTDSDGRPRLRAWLADDGTILAPLMFDPTGRLTIRAGEFVAINTIAPGVSVDAAAMAGDGLLADSVTHRLTVKANMAAFQFLPGGILDLAALGTEPITGVTVKDGTGSNITLQFDALGRFCGTA